MPPFHLSHSITPSVYVSLVFYPDNDENLTGYRCFVMPAGLSPPF